MNKIINYFVPSNLTVEDKRPNKAIILVGALLAICMTTIIWLPYVLLLGETQLLIPGIVSSLGCGLTLWYIKRTQNLDTATMLFALNGLALFFYVILISGGSTSPFLIWLTLFPSMSILLRSRQAFLVNITLSSLFVLTLGVLSIYEFEFTRILIVEEKVLHNILSIIVLGVFFTILIYQYDNNTQKYTEQLAQSNRELEKFAYIASHDMKEPLRNIISFSQLLKKRSKGKLNQDESEYLDIILNNSRQLHELVEDVLEFSRLNRDVEDDLKKVDLNEIVKEAMYNLKVLLVEKNAQVVYSELPQVRATEIHLIQLFQNLIENGIKYNQNDVPQITITLINDTKNYIFNIIDNGIGINIRYHEQVFEMFKRLHTRKEYEGTGIGLALCKKIVEQYKGTLTIEKSSSAGTVFRLMFPKE